MTNKNLMNIDYSLSALLLASITVAAQSKPAADLIITHAKIWTVDAAHPEAQAVAILRRSHRRCRRRRRGLQLARPANAVIDADGKLVLPGFNDSHVHFVTGGSQLDNVQLNDVTSAAGIFPPHRAAREDDAQRVEWILGGDWDETKWTPAELPTKEQIDPVTGDTPVFVSRYDGHMGLANSLALRARRHHGADSRSARRRHCSRRTREIPPAP